MKNTIFFKSLKEIKLDLILSMLLDFLSIFVFLTVAGAYYYLYGYVSDRAVFELNILYVIFYVLITIIALILTALNSAYFRHLIYRISAGQKSSFKAHLKFSFFWVLPWMILFIVLLSGDSSPFVIVFFGLIYLFLTTIARNVMRDSFKDTLKKMSEIIFSANNLYKLLIHYFIMLLFFVFLLAVAGLTFKIDENLFYTLFVAVILFYMSWARSYLGKVIVGLKK